MGKTKQQIQKEFNDFAEKVAQLEGLRHELNALDTKGFESEVKIIRAKLKDVGAIGSIRKDISSLKDKIAEKKAVKIEASARNLRKKITKLEKKIAGKRKTARKVLSKDEISDVKDIPKLEGELKKLRAAFEEHMKGGKVKVNSGVGVIVDSRFDDFVNALKSDLTEKLKAEEAEIRMKEETAMNADLNRRKEAFAKKTANLEEAETRELMKKEEALKKKEEAVERKADRMEEITSKEIYKKEEALKKKEEAVERKADRMEEIASKEIYKKEEALKKKEEMFKKKGAEIIKKAHEDYEKKVKRELENRVRSCFNAEVKEKITAIKDNVINETKRKVLSNMMKINEKKLGEAVRMQKSKMSSEMKSTMDAIKARMHNNMIKETKAEVKKREAEIRKSLEREYNNKMRREMEIKNSEIQKKKAQLEAFVAAQAKKMFR